MSDHQAEHEELVRSLSRLSRDDLLLAAECDLADPAKRDLAERLTAVIAKVDDNPNDERSPTSADGLIAGGAR